MLAFALIDEIDAPNVILLLPNTSLLPSESEPEVKKVILSLIVNVFAAIFPDCVLLPICMLENPSVKLSLKQEAGREKVPVAPPKPIVLEADCGAIINWPFAEVTVLLEPKVRLFPKSEIVLPFELVIFPFTAMVPP